MSIRIALMATGLLSTSLGCLPNQTATTLKTPVQDPANDERSIRHWYEQWIKASKEGDLPSAKALIADDAIFLVPGADRMSKESYAAAATASDPNTEVQLESSIQEIKVLGDHAWLWTKYSLTMTNKQSKARSLWAGHSLAVLKRHGSGWVVIRNADTLVPVKQD